MNLKELEKFRLTKAINFNNDLNPQLYVDDKMRPNVRLKMVEIVEHFKEFMGIEELALVDVTLSGSNAAYSYTPHSDIDLHLIVDFSLLSNNEVYKEMFDAKKYQYNDQHDIKIKGYDVELYVQDSTQPHASLGNYSILNDEWNRFPTRQRANLDEESTYYKYNKLKQLSLMALASGDEAYVNGVLGVIKRYRQAGLSENGEFGPENLAFKMIRKDGLFEKMWDMKRSFEDRSLSLETVIDAVDTDLEIELAAEFGEFGKPKIRSAEDIIKELYTSNDALFDDYDYDDLHRMTTSFAPMLDEASYSGNLCAMEVMQFYQQAPKHMIDVVSNLIAQHKNKEAWELIQKHQGVELVGKEFHNESSIGHIYDTGDATHMPEDIIDVAEWLNTNPNNLMIEMKNEPIAKFIDQIKEMHGTYDEFPGDQNRTDKIRRELRTSNKVYPIYVAKDDERLFVMEGRHRMVAFYLEGMKTIPVAYVSTAFNEDELMFCVEGDNNVLVHHPISHQLQEHRRRVFPNELTESFDNKILSRINNFLSTEVSLPKIGDAVHTLSIMFAEDPINNRNIIYLKGHMKPLTVLSVDTTNITLRTAKGIEVIFPTRFDNALTFFDTFEAIQQLKTWLAISFADFEFIENIKESYIVNEQGQIVKGVNTTVDVDSYQPPEIEVGDEVKVGKFKNRKATVKGFDTDKDNQPVLKTTKGDHKLFKPRISKLEVEEGVGIITTQNQTADVGPNQTKIEAAKLGMVVTKGGIPPLLKTNGKTKTVGNIMEGIESFDTVDVDEIHLSEIREFLNQHPTVLESFNNNDLISFLNQYKTTPTPGKKYVYTSVAVTPPVNIISINSLPTSAPLIKIEHNYAFFDINGKVTRYPADDRDGDDMLLHRLFFSDSDELAKFKTAISLKLADWRVIVKTLPNRLSEKQTKIEVVNSDNVITVEYDDIHKDALIEYYRSNPAIAESSNDFTQVRSFISQYDLEPIINRSYIYSSIMIIPNLFVSVNTLALSELTGVDDGYMYFKTPFGDRRYPADEKEKGNILQTSIIFKTQEEYDTFRTALLIQFSDLNVKFGNIEPVSVTEGILTELKMSPGRLQKEVNKITQTLNPIIGLEFEVCIEATEGQNPDVTDETSMQDLHEYFNNTPEEDDAWQNLESMHMEWVRSEIEPAWVAEEVRNSRNHPSEDYDEKLEHMTGMYSSISSVVYIAKITGAEDDIEVTEEIAKKTLDVAQQAYKKLGNADGWAADEYGDPEHPIFDAALDPYIMLYHAIFIQEPEDAIETLTPVYQQMFWDYETGSSESSLGSFLLKHQIQSFRAVGIEFDGLYSDYGAGPEGYATGSFSYDDAQRIADEISMQLSVDVEVVEEDYNEGRPGDDLTTHPTEWLIAPDSSIKPDDEDDSGMEIIMPPTPYEEGIENIQQMMRLVVQNNGYTNESTGLHINVSMQNVSQDKLDYAKLVLLVGDSEVAKNFDREYNEFALNSLRTLSDYIDSTQGYETEKKEKAQGYANMMAKMRTKLDHTLMNSFADAGLGSVDFGKNTSVGIKDNRIEFRSAGGTDYIQNFSGVLETINRFVYAYSIAIDPDAAKKEYAKKLYKLATNIRPVKTKEDKQAITLFAAFNSGTIDKSALIGNLKMIAQARAAAKQAAQDNDDIDRGEPRTAKDKGIVYIADVYGVQVPLIADRWEEGETFEREHGIPAHSDIDKIVYRNLLNDIGHYQ